MFSDWNDQFKLIDCVCEAEYDEERHKGADKSVDEDVLDVFEELFFL
jgi:hypothetical protein